METTIATSRKGFPSRNSVASPKVLKISKFLVVYAPMFYAVDQPGNGKSLPNLFQVTAEYNPITDYTILKSHKSFFGL